MENVVIRLLVLSILILPSCKERQPTQSEVVRRNAEVYVKSRMNDPQSYKYVKLELIDSILFSKNIDYRIGRIKESIEDYQMRLQQQHYYKRRGLSHLYDEKLVLEIEGKIEKRELALNKIDSIKLDLGIRINNVATYTYIYGFREKNIFGALVLQEYFLQTGPAPEFDVINMAAERDKVFITTNIFPGYRELILPLLL